jgi:hypothetical protein
MGPGPRVTTFPIVFSFQTWFLGIYLNFQQQKSLKHQYLPHFESKSYQINSIKSCSSRSFQQHQRHFPVPQNFQLRVNLIFGEEIIHYSITFAHQAHAHLLLASFRKTPGTWFEATPFHGSHKYKTNKQPSIIDRCSCENIAGYYSIFATSTDVCGIINYFWIFHLKNIIFWRFNIFLHKVVIFANEQILNYFNISKNNIIYVEIAKVLW